MDRVWQWILRNKAAVILLIFTVILALAIHYIFITVIDNL